MGLGLVGTDGQGHVICTLRVAPYPRRGAPRPRSRRQSAPVPVRTYTGDRALKRGVCDIMCSFSHHTEAALATNLALDPDLLDRAFALSGEKTKKAAVTRALQEFIARREQARMVELFATLDWDPGYDHKAERSRE